MAAGWLGDLRYRTNNALLSVGRRTDCLSHRKICTFETCPWWNFIPQLTCLVPPRKDLCQGKIYGIAGKRLHKKGFTCVGGCVGAWILKRLVD